MVTIRLKILTVILAFIAGFAIANFTFAATLTPLEYSSLSDIQYFTNETDEYWISYEPDGTYYNASGGTIQQVHNCPVSDTGNSDCFTNQYDPPNLTGTDDFFRGGTELGNFHVLIVPESTYNEITGVGCFSSYQECLDSGDAGITQDFLIVYTEPNENSTWNNSAGFWGDDFSTASVTGTLAASVQSTGADIWPLLIFLGVSLAFIIFLQVVFLTKKSVKPSNKKDFDPVAFNKKADELEEFYSKTGGASDEIVETITKRRRGRPRKYPIIE